jgi:hypothetical protein
MPKIGGAFSAPPGAPGYFFRIVDAAVRGSRRAIRAKPLLTKRMVRLGARHSAHLGRCLTLHLSKRLLSPNVNAWIVQFDRR